MSLLGLILRLSLILFFDLIPGESHYLVFLVFLESHRLFLWSSGSPVISFCDL